MIAETAAKKLIPYTLELGGKSPVIVDKNVNIEQAARKIAWGKFLNAGQTCVAPDYVLVHEDVKQDLIDNLIKSIKSFMVYLFRKVKIMVVLLIVKDLED